MEPNRFKQPRPELPGLYQDPDYEPYGADARSDGAHTSGGHGVSHPDDLMISLTLDYLQSIGRR
ncbi:MAG: hypothetical protein P8076_12245 [Gammaproteobacteria bacterium]